jgi:hypothetical protein
MVQVQALISISNKTMDIKCNKDHKLLLNRIIIISKTDINNNNFNSQLPYHQQDQSIQNKP